LPSSPLIARTEIAGAGFINFFLTAEAYGRELAAIHERAERYARQLLDRWGVLLRDLLARETLAPPWRDLLGVLRRMEARGEIRGGRFVSGFTGEQFARPEALSLLRMIRREPDRHPTVAVANADPLNLAGIILPGPRVSRLAIVGLTPA